MGRNLPTPVNPNPSNLPWCFYANVASPTTTPLTTPTSTPTSRPSSTITSPYPSNTKLVSSSSSSTVSPIIQFSITNSLSPTPSPTPSSSSNNNNGGVRTTIHTTYHWHLEQPIYWPTIIPDNSITYQKAYDSMQLQYTYNDGHPWQNIGSIFSDPDRVAVYQYIAATSIDSVSNIQDMGASVSYSGELIENVNSLAYEGNQLYGYEQNYNQTYAQVIFPSFLIYIYLVHSDIDNDIDIDDD